MTLSNLPYRDNLYMAKLVHDGIPASALDEIATAFGISPSALAPVVQIAARTLMRRRTSKALLKPDETERALRIGRLLQIATEVFADKDTAGKWFKRELQVLGGRTPLELCATEPGAREVEQVLGRIEQGIFG